jgi:hypothetical protein
MQKDFRIACESGIQLALDFPRVKKVACAHSRAPLPGYKARYFPGKLHRNLRGALISEV